MARMDLTHHISVPASLDDTWAVFARPERLAPCFPGATVTAADGDDFTGSIKIKLGPLALVYEGAGRYVKRDVDLRRLEIEFRGEDRRGHGAAESTVIAAFTAAGGATEIEVSSDLTITGKPQQFGSSVLSDANDRLLDQFASCIAGRFADGSIHESDPELEPTVEAPTGKAQVDAVQLPAEVPGEPRRGPSESAPSLASTAVAARRAPAPARVAEGPPVWVPARNLAEPDFAVLSRVLPPLLKRYWPFLGGAGAAAFVVSKLAAGKKTKYKKTNQKKEKQAR